MAPAPLKTNRGHDWVAILAAVLALLAVDARLRIRHQREVTSTPGMMVAAPAIDPQSFTGYELTQRQVVLPRRGTDGYHWIMQAQQMSARSDWRLRHVDYDNAPDGREVHWSIPYRWWIAALGWVDGAVSGRPDGMAVEHAALLANPILLGACLLLLIPMVTFRFGAVSAFLAGACVLGSPALYNSFDAGAIDHHGLAAICALACVLGLLAAARRQKGKDGPPLSEDRGMRRWLTVSALCGAAGMWVSAASQIPVLIGLGMGAIVVSWLNRRHGGDGALPPEAWRWWGIVGGVGCMAAYLTEYFPSHLGLRLEVNHPLYALAWFCGGELLCRIGCWLERGAKPAGMRAWAMVAGAAAGVAAVPVVILVARGEVFLVSDPFLWSLHEHYLGEFQSAWFFISRSPLDLAAVARWVPLLIVPVAGVVLFRRVARGAERDGLLLALAPAVLVLVLAFDQMRWLGLACALLVAVLIVLARLINDEPRRRRVVVGSLAFAAFVPGVLASLLATPGKGEFSGTEVRQLAERDVAHWLRQRAGGEPLVVASGPGSTTKLLFFGGGRGLGTFYWENIAGLRTSAALFSTASEDEMERIVREHGVTHLVLFSWDGFEDAFARLARGIPPEESAPGTSVVSRMLRQWRVPVWLRPLPYKLPRHPTLSDQSALVFEVTEHRPPGAAGAHLAQFFAETEREDLARRLLPSLAAETSDLLAQLTVASLQWDAGDGAGFAGTIERVVHLLPGADSLGLEDRIRLAGTLVRGRFMEPAVRELHACARLADERALRRLSPGILVEFLILTEELRIPLGEPGLRTRAEAWVPPYLREAR